MFNVDTTNLKSDGFNETKMTLAELKDLYTEVIDKKEFQTFEIWLYDVRKSGLVTEISEEPEL